MNAAQTKDNDLRSRFSDLFDNVRREGNMYTRVGSNQLTGELNSDANYSNVLDGREHFRRENQVLKQKVNELENA